MITIILILGIILVGYITLLHFFGWLFAMTKHDKWTNGLLCIAGIVFCVLAIVSITLANFGVKT